MSCNLTLTFSTNEYLLTNVFICYLREHFTLQLLEIHIPIYHLLEYS